jgi:hypothetical protein
MSRYLSLPLPSSLQSKINTSMTVSLFPIALVGAEGVPTIETP